ncbi:hypothetical protein KR009_011968 [Drosophila setifemur]|nr:hypothetical protein KR009_011968 [Drosophila setifemur]
MDCCHNDIFAPLILAVMLANGHPLTLDEIVDGLTEVINSQIDYRDTTKVIGDGRHSRNHSRNRRRHRQLSSKRRR